MAGYRVLGGGTSGGGGGTGNVAIGPSFGQSAGDDQSTFDLGVNLDISAIDLAHTKTIGVDITGDLAYANTNTIGIDILGDLGYVNTKTVGSNIDISAIDLDHAKTIGSNITMPSLALANTKTAGAHLSGTVLSAPFWQSVSTKALATTLGATQIICNTPASIAVGDFLLAWVGTSDATAPTINTPTGWTSGSGMANGSAGMQGRAFWRIADGTEGASVTFTFSASTLRATAEIHRVNATDPTTPMNVAASGNASVISPVVVGVTTTVVNCLVFGFVLHAHTVSQVHSPPASHVERTEFQDTNVTLFSSSSYTRVFALAAATGTATVTCDELAASQSIYVRVAIAPGTLTIAT